MEPAGLLLATVTAGVGIAQAQACGCGWDGLAALATLVWVMLAQSAFAVYPAHREAAAMLAMVVAGGGLLLAARTGPGLLLVGGVGAALAAAALRSGGALRAHPGGMAAVAGAATWLVVVGADHGQRQGFSAMATVSGVSLALLVAAGVWVSVGIEARSSAIGVPGSAAMHRGPGLATAVLGGWVILAHAWVAVWWWVDWLPFTAWWALGSAPLSAAAVLLLWRRSSRAQPVQPVVALCLAAAVLHGGLLTAAFVAVARLR